MVGPDQAVSLDDAIRAVTINAARQIGQGDRLGSLEKGKERISRYSKAIPTR